MLCTQQQPYFKIGYFYCPGRCETGPVYQGQKGISLIFINFCRHHFHFRPYSYESVNTIFITAGPTKRSSFLCIMRKENYSTCGTFYYSTKLYELLYCYAYTQSYKILHWNNFKRHNIFTQVAFISFALSR